MVIVSWEHQALAPALAPALAGFLVVMCAPTTTSSIPIIAAMPRSHAQRDNYLPLASQRESHFAIYHCHPNPSLPGPYYYWPGNPVIKPSGYAGLINYEQTLHAKFCAYHP
ncbi:hypothetical protein [Candidatus Spongiihabitans sp.]|uniref:hypothetical protein n=1 Tax=Candidatus Spongiihabitans sp. TaxID=3101308 RepID=UPI003C7E6EC6